MCGDRLARCASMQTRWAPGDNSRLQSAYQVRFQVASNASVRVLNLEAELCIRRKCQSLSCQICLCLRFKLLPGGEPSCPLIRRYGHAEIIRSQQGLSPVAVNPDCSHILARHSLCSPTRSSWCTGSSLRRARVGTQRSGRMPFKLISGFTTVPPQFAVTHFLQ